jgi:hypothetical protein
VAPPDLQLFFDAAASDERRARAALDAIAAGWRPGYAALFVDLARFLPADRSSPAQDPAFEEGDEAAFGRPAPPARAPWPAPAPTAGGAARRRLISFLRKQTGQRFGDDLRAWRRWIWSGPYDPHPDYAAFKAAVYGRVDPRMSAFFRPGVASAIRLDEVDWGGVAVNGIPPLDHPRIAAAAAAGWLKDSHVVFGIVVNGEARAYPKRVLAWHEMARDRLGGLELTIVYCTLCGTVVPYRSEAGGRTFTFGTSGLLYRSNKLMFDEETLSLWNTTEGRPVVGPLTGSGLELQALPVVTTTWGEWRATHPGTTVVDRDTGHDRDYSEGAAYRSYFATDDLMFEVPRTDRRLRNKAEVLGVLLKPAGAADGRPRALAVSAQLLRRRPLYPLAFAGHSLLVVTSPQGANRVYATDGRRLVGGGAWDELRDEGGMAWAVHEDALRPASASAPAFPRVPARRAFWFGWHAQFPDTELVK